MSHDPEGSDALFQFGVCAAFGILVGVGTSSWCLGFAAALAVLVHLIRR